MSKLPVKKHIVLITTWFPPISGVAVNRMLAMAKYLDRDKFDVSVLTLLTKGALREEEIHGCRIYRVENKPLFQSPTFDSKDGPLKHKLKVLKKMALSKIQKRELNSWSKASEKKIVELHSKRPIDLIISSFSPAEPHIVAANFVTNHKETKWIADMRDEMSENNALQPSERTFLADVEKSVDKLASAVVTVSLPIVDYFKTTFPSVQFIKEIRNGFDHTKKPIRSHFNDTFTMVYAGSFYGSRKPNTFFEALLDCQDNLPEKWKIQFVGTIKNFSVPPEFADNVEFVPRVSQEKSIEYMRYSDANIIIHPAERRKGIFTGKLFDYASVERPILAIIDENDVAAKLIQDMNLGFVADFHDVGKIQMSILKIINLWESKTAMEIDSEAVRGLHRKFQIEQLSKLSDIILNPN